MGGRLLGHGRLIGIIRYMYVVTGQDVVMLENVISSTVAVYTNDAD